MSPLAATSIVPKIVTWQCAPRIIANDWSAEKKEDPYFSVTVCLPALIRSQSSCDGHRRARPPREATDAGGTEAGGAGGGRSGRREGQAAGRLHLSAVGEGADAEHAVLRL